MPTTNIPTIIPVDEINQASGHTVDGEGLLNNYAIEPEMYEEDGGDVSDQLKADRVTVVDTFSSEQEAKDAVLAMEQKGLRTGQTSIIAKDYEDPESVMNWKNIAAEGGLKVVLKGLGISNHATLQFVEAVEKGEFLVVEIGNDRDASQAQHVLEKAGHVLES